MTTDKTPDEFRKPRVYRGETYHFLFCEKNEVAGSVTTVAARDGRLEEVRFQNWEELPVAKE